MQRAIAGCHVGVPCCLIAGVPFLGAMAVVPFVGAIGAIAG